MPALGALYWHLTKRRVRARNRLSVASAGLPIVYTLWIEAKEHTEELRLNCKSRIEQWSWRPRFTIIIHSAQQSSSREVRQSIDSVERQIYQNSDVIRCVCEPLGSAILASDAHFVVLLRAGDLLAESALFRFAEMLQANPSTAILYGDQDRLDNRGRRTQPWFKPRWNEELFLAQDYISSALAIRTPLARRAATQAGGKLSALVLEAALTADAPILHVPYIISHITGVNEVASERIGVVAEHLRRRGVMCVPGPFGTIKLQWPLPEQLPLVSIIIPTKDKVELLQPCIESLLERTAYNNFEVLVVDNDSSEKRTAEFLERIRKNPDVRVLSYGRPFNYSAINNFAVRHAAGSYLCLLNNDTEIVEPSWLSDLMRYAVRAEIGAAGAKLLYQDGSIQHAGVVVGIGEAAGHAHRFLPHRQPGYFAMSHVAQFISAVTGACLVVEKRKFNLVGGLDEENLAVAFNDVDLCLKLEAAGWRNVYVPHAVLVHHESKSRGNDMAPAQFNRYRRELEVLQKRWGTKTYSDPSHNPNLDRYSETFVLRL